MYKKFKKLLEEHNVTAYKVAKDNEIATVTFTHWKQGKYTPKTDKLQKISDYFGVPITYFLEENESDKSE